MCVTSRLKLPRFGEPAQRVAGTHAGTRGDLPVKHGETQKEKSVTDQVKKDLRIMTKLSYTIHGSAKRLRRV